MRRTALGDSSLCSQIKLGWLDALGFFAVYGGFWRKFTYKVYKKLFTNYK